MLHFVLYHQQCQLKYHQARHQQHKCHHYLPQHRHQHRQQIIRFEVRQRMPMIRVLGELGFELLGLRIIFEGLETPSKSLGDCQLLIICRASSAPQLPARYQRLDSLKLGGFDQQGLQRALQQVFQLLYGLFRLTFIQCMELGRNSDRRAKFQKYSASGHMMVMIYNAQVSSFHTCRYQINQYILLLQHIEGSHTYTFLKRQQLQLIMSNAFRKNRYNLPPTKFILYQCIFLRSIKFRIDFEVKLTLNMDILRIGNHHFLITQNRHHPVFFLLAVYGLIGQNRCETCATSLHSITNNTNNMTCTCPSKIFRPIDRNRINSIQQVLQQGSLEHGAGNSQGDIPVHS